MAVITAKGNTEFGKMTVKIHGEARAEKIDCDPPGMTWYIERAIDRAEGWIANGYHPDGGTMLQAYAYLRGLFGSDAVTVDGELEEIPCGDEGAIY